MNYDQAALVICLTLFIVVGVNAAIFALKSNRRSISQIELLQRAARRAPHPWQDEEQAMEELARRVAELNKGDENG